MLFVTPANRAETNLKLQKILRGLPAKSYNVEAIDITKDTARASEYKVAKTPALKWTTDMRSHIFYDLDDDYAIQYALGIKKLW